MRDIQTTIQALEGYIQAFPSAIRRLTEEELQHRPAPGKWSKIEFMGHLVDSATYNWQRFVNIQFEEKPFVIVSYAQEELVKRNDYQNQSLEELLSLWQLLNRQICRRLKQLSPEQLAWKVIAYGDKEGTLAWWADDYTQHLEHHLSQILGSLDVLAAKDAWHLPLEVARKKLAAQQASPFLELMRHGSMTVELYHPVGKDYQQPHSKDELYVIANGTSWFFHEGSRRKVGTGDVLFVPAGDVHRFEDFTEDFQTWVIFYGPEGGEKRSSE
ncbi:MAG: DinB family protein [Bacteroidota bacterium]